MAMELTVDRQRMNARTLASWGVTIDVFDMVKTHGGFVMEGDGGLALFVRNGPREYRVTVGFDPDNRGAAAIKALNDAYAWVFENTDTQKLVGYIRSGDKPALLFTSHLIGGEIESDDGLTVVASITRERWAKARAG